jgi:DnaK suppressor protein
MDTARAQELLASERTRLERTLTRLGRHDDGDSNHGTNPAELGTDLFQEELDQGLAEDLREQLAALERAEARLADGTYGLSIESGEPIPDERLEVVPTAEYTVDEERSRGR